MIAKLAADRSGWQAAPAIVLDLRGNNGGSSDWSRQIAAVIWGAARVASADLGTQTVQWRVSSANIGQLKNYLAASKADRNSTPDENASMARKIEALQAAQTAGAELWQPPPEIAAAPVSDATAPYRGQVIMLTDPGCASACLDAADLWLALGAIQVGQETAGDTQYMDIRREVLPSGFARAVVPMKLYRGRKRASNETYAPTYRYAGSLADTTKVQAWVMQLVRSRLARAS